ncbi:MAG: hypothetical protein FJY66_01565 [Calditrichaeota bacterium]|nr:hypothetical protein [Calditrichota bacterium]
MKITKWICFGVPVLIGVGMLLASQTKDIPFSVPRKIEFTDRSEGIIGRPLTSAESTTVARAIDSIGTPPPATVVCTLNTQPCTLRCDCVAAALRRQLRRPGGIEAEKGPRKKRARATTKADSLDSPEGDQVNISEDFLRNVGQNLNRLKYLESILIHEYGHKRQTKATMANPATAEKEGYAMALAYKDSIGMDWTDTDYWEEMKAHQSFSVRLAGGESRLLYTCPALTHECLILYDTAGGAAGDSFVSFQLGDVGHYSYSFNPMRASDMLLFENHFLLPDSHCLGLVCGGLPFLNLAQLLMLDIYHGEVVASLGTLDFPGMFFYSMTYSYETELYYFLDTLNQQIISMADMNADSIPETMVWVYASAFWPGFGPLLNMRGVDAGSHAYHGAGIAVNHFDIHLGESIDPYSDLFFLPDYDGNNMADACLLVPRYEFLTFTPVIQVPLPWAGDFSVMLHATWEHDIGVFTTDPLGQFLWEPLGMTHMVAGVDAECMLLRPLMPEEFILAMDMQTGGKSSPVQVINPVPQEVTMIRQSPALLHLRWDAVPGADYYAIYKSNEPFEFPPAPSYFSETNEIILPLADDVKFYRVTAVR